MATQGNVTPSSDQPRVTEKSLRESNNSPTLNYRQTGFNNYGSRNSMTKTRRDYGR